MSFRSFFGSTARAGFASSSLRQKRPYSIAPADHLLSHHWNRFVDIYLYHADSETIATSFLGIDNSRGMIGIRPDDEWWPTVSETSWEQGTNQTWPYFFVIVDANATITGGEEHQSTFVAVRESAFRFRCDSGML